MCSTRARAGSVLRSRAISPDDSGAGHYAVSDSSLTPTPIGHVHGARAEVEDEDDYWGGAESRIVLNESVEESALEGIETFSHAEILFVFDRVEDAKIIRGAPPA